MSFKVFLKKIKIKKIKIGKAIPALDKMDVNKNPITKTYTPNTQRTFCRHPLRGSMTVEAALVFPMVLFVWAAFISMTSVVRVYESVQQSLTNTALQLAVEAGEDEASVRDGWLVRAWADLSSVENLETGGIRRVSGYSFVGSSVLEDNQWLILQVQYKVKLMEGLLPIPEISLKNRVYVRAWSGWQPGDGGLMSGEGQKNVYVTDYGSVYHKDRMCSHIRLKIYMVSEGEAMKYAPCAKCAVNSPAAPSTFYVTETGDCYHSRFGCSGLKRSVQRLTIEEAASGGYSPCGRCGGESE